LVVREPVAVENAIVVLFVVETAVSLKLVWGSGRSAVGGDIILLGWELPFMIPLQAPKSNTCILSDKVQIVHRT